MITLFLDLNQTHELSQNMLLLASNYSLSAMTQDIQVSVFHYKSPKKESRNDEITCNTIPNDDIQKPSSIKTKALERRQSSTLVNS